jgi:lipid II isoglutaminyl synthase (glutamine-hydrolysing)
MPRTSLRDAVATGAVRAVNRISRLSSRGSGTVIGGRVGLAIAPNLLRDLAQRRDVILVSGTNGKTTTTAMIAVGWGERTTTNDTGSNMPAGHVAALAESKSASVVLEVDEAWLGDVTRATKPKVVTLLNLSRDQLDRANEVRRIAERWRDVVASERETTYVANANDPLVVYAAELAEKVKWCDVPTPWTTDAVSCPHCTQPLHFGDGSWWSECGFKKPDVMTSILRDQLTLGGALFELHLQLPGEFNEVDASLALTALSCVGVDVPLALTRISSLTSVAGRFSEVLWRGHRLRLLLAKNPAGFTAMLATLTTSVDDVWISINARLADGHDPSWLYDVPFEVLRGQRVFCFGDRRLDLAARLEYAGVEYIVVDDETVLPAAHQVINVVSNYTAFQDWRVRSTPC